MHYRIAALAPLLAAGASPAPIVDASQLEALRLAKFDLKKVITQAKANGFPIEQLLEMSKNMGVDLKELQDLQKDIESEINEVKNEVVDTIKQTIDEEPEVMEKVNSIVREGQACAKKGNTKECVNRLASSKMQELVDMADNMFLQASADDLCDLDLNRQFKACKKVRTPKGAKKVYRKQVPAKLVREMAQKLQKKNMISNEPVDRPSQLIKNVMRHIQGQMQQKEMQKKLNNYAAEASQAGKKLVQVKSWPKKTEDAVDEVTKLFNKHKENELVKSVLKFVNEQAGCDKKPEEEEAPIVCFFVAFEIDDDMKSKMVDMAQDVYPVMRNMLQNMATAGTKSKNSPIDQLMKSMTSKRLVKVQA